MSLDPEIDVPKRRGLMRFVDSSMTSVMPMIAMAALVSLSLAAGCTGSIEDGGASSGVGTNEREGTLRPVLGANGSSNGAATTTSALPRVTTPDDAGDAGSSASPTPTTTAPTGLLVAYYAAWTRATMPPSAIPWDHLTHVAHAFVQPNATGGLASISTYVDTELIAQAHAHGVRVVASVGGEGVSFDGLADPVARAATVSDLASLCGSYGYDGIDVDWEFPDATSASLWTSFLSELRVALDAVRPGLSLSAAISAGAAGDVLPVDALDALTWVGAMTYDYAGGWSETSGHVAPLYPSSGGDGGSVSQSIQHLVARGVAPSKLLLGLPFYGAEFGASAIASTPVAPETTLDYRDVVALPPTDGWTAQRDATAQVPYLQRAASPGFLSYDDASSIAAKCAFAKSSALGGAMIWHLAGDRLADGSDPLLDAAQSCR